MVILVIFNHDKLQVPYLLAKSAGIKIICYYCYDMRSYLGAYTKVKVFITF